MWQPGPILALAILFVFLTIFAPHFLTVRNFTNVLPFNRRNIYARDGNKCLFSPSRQASGPGLPSPATRVSVSAKAVTVPPPGITDYKARIGYVPDGPYFYDHLNAPELLRFYGTLFYKDGKKVVPKMIGKLVTPLSLFEHAACFPPDHK